MSARDGDQVSLVGGDGGEERKLVLSPMPMCRVYDCGASPFKAAEVLPAERGVEPSVYVQTCHTGVKGLSHPSLFTYFEVTERWRQQAESHFLHKMCGSIPAQVVMVRLHTLQRQ